MMTETIIVILFDSLNWIYTFSTRENGCTNSICWVDAPVCPLPNVANIAAIDSNQSADKLRIFEIYSRLSEFLFVEFPELAAAPLQKTGAKKFVVTGHHALERVLIFFRAQKVGSINYEFTKERRGRGIERSRSVKH